MRAENEGSPIEPRPYVLTRLIIDIAAGRAGDRRALDQIRFRCRVQAAAPRRHEGHEVRLTGWARWQIEHHAVPNSSTVVPASASMRRSHSWTV